MQHRILPTQLQDMPVEANSSNKRLIKQKSVQSAGTDHSTYLNQNYNMFEDSGVNELNEKIQLYSTELNDVDELNETPQFYNIKTSDVDEGKDTTQFIRVKKSFIPIRDSSEINETIQFVNNIFPTAHDADEKNDKAELLKLQEKRIFDDVSEKSVFKINAKLSQFDCNERNIFPGSKYTEKSKNAESENFDFYYYTNKKDSISVKQSEIKKLDCLEETSKNALQEINQTPMIARDLVKPNHPIPEIIETNQDRLKLKLLKLKSQGSPEDNKWIDRVLEKRF